MADARGACKPSSASTSCRPITKCVPSPRKPRPVVLPRFYGEFPSIIGDLRFASQPVFAGLSPTNQARDGKYRKIKVELVNPEMGSAEGYREWQADQVFDYCQDRIHCAARSGVVLGRKA